jgi:hypothetical protein
VAVEIGDVSLERITQVAVRERARIVHHAVPGLAGELAQTGGRPSVEVELRGIFYGPTATEDLGRLRAVYLEQRPVDFFAEAIGEAYFTQVLVSGLDIRQRAGALDEFEFACHAVEYVEPPEPAVIDPLGGLDTVILGEAAGFMDDVQNAIAQVSDLVDALANIPSFGNPTERLNEMPRGYQDLVSGSGVGALETVRNLF